MVKNKSPLIKKKISRITLSTYEETVKELKERIRTAQIKASLSVNEKLIELYWDIGNTIVQKQKEEGWGSKIIGTLSKDLKTSFPRMAGLSPRNLLYMKQFAEAYPDFQITQQAVAKLPWGHNVILIERLKDKKQRLWYAQKAIVNGWSRSVLETWIDSNLFKREGKAITNFKNTVPKLYSDLAEQTLKDPYCFDFLSMREEAEEREIEEGLIDHIQKFLTELGVGFAYVGKQFKLEVEGDEFFIDLLFYHYKLRCFVVVELKNTAFKPEYAGKMSLYLSAVDATVKHPDDQPSIGMILCKTKKKLVVEYTLQNTRKPIGVATYKMKLIKSLPKNLKSNLPSIKQLEKEFKPRKIAKKS